MIRATFIKPLQNQSFSPRTSGSKGIVKKEYMGTSVLEYKQDVSALTCMPVGIPDSIRHICDPLPAQHISGTSGLVGYIGMKQKQVGTTT